MNLPMAYELNTPNYNDRSYKDDFFDLLVETINTRGLPVTFEGLVETDDPCGPFVNPKDVVGKVTLATREGNKVMVSMDLNDSLGSKLLASLVEAGTVKAVWFSSVGEVREDKSVVVTRIVSCTPLDDEHYYINGNADV